MGSTSPLTVAVIAVVLVLAATASQVGSALIADAKAGGAADLAALAAAQVDRDLRAQGVPAGAALDRACDTAKDLSRRNGARLTACARGLAGSVIVSVTIARWPGPASARSRAGPAWG